MKFVTTLAFIVLSLPSVAAIQPVLDLSLDFGGETLVDVVYLDGSKSSLEAGRGVTFRGGVVMPLGAEGPQFFEGQATLGYKFGQTREATNGSVTFRRIPWELMGFYRDTQRNFRLGAGLSYQTGVRLEGTKDVAALSADFENAFGVLLAGDYFAGVEKNLLLGARYTMINYKADLPGARTISGNAVGFNLGYLFP